MISAAITAAIGAVLSFFGIAPGPYLAGIWLAIKLLLVGGAALLGWRALRRRRPEAAVLEVSSTEDRLSRR